jgi:hypothetical protein
VTAAVAAQRASAGRTVGTATTGGTAAFRPVRSNQAALRDLAAAGLPVQAKLAIGAVDDPLEREADRVADRVMRMPAPAMEGDLGSTRDAVAQRACCAGCEQTGNCDETARRTPGATVLQRAAEDDAIKEQLVQAYLKEADTDTLQRQPDEQQNAEQPKPDDDSVAGEKILMQAKFAGRPSAHGGSSLESSVRALDCGGQPLPASVRTDMEARFGHDFSGVRVHADGGAAELARRTNARAFTVGRNVVFGSGEYAPGSSEGRRLLAHELTHVIQQGRARTAVQRTITVAGKAYTPTVNYLGWINVTYGPAMKEFVEHMHNGGASPDFPFSSFEQLRKEVAVRANAIKGMEEVHKGCCAYFSTANPPYLDSTFWDHPGPGPRFTLKSPLPPGKQPSDAIDAIFARGANTRLECNTMALAIEYYATLKGLGAAAFNAKFPSGIIISPDDTPLETGPTKKFEVVGVASKSAIQPGDWVYFKNFRDYTAKVPGGFWQGENAIAMGNNMYRGFGVASMSESDLNKELVSKYNAGAGTSKTEADLLADGGGLLLNPVIRPIIAKLAP